MLIHEAIRSTTVHAPCIARISWDRLSQAPHGGIKLQPTDSPDGCIIISDVKDGRRRGWQPTAADLIADDWIVIGL